MSSIYHEIMNIIVNDYTQPTNADELAVNPFVQMNNSKSRGLGPHIFGAKTSQMILCTGRWNNCTSHQIFCLVLLSRRLTNVVVVAEPL